MPRTRHVVVSHVVDVIAKMSKGDYRLGSLPSISPQSISPFSFFLILFLLQTVQSQLRAEYVHSTHLRGHARHTTAVGGILRQEGYQGGRGTVHIFIGHTNEHTR